MPAAVAAGLPETTTPLLPTATLGPRELVGVLVACGQAKAVSKKRESDDAEMIVRIGSILLWPRSLPAIMKGISSPYSTVALAQASNKWSRLCSLPHRSIGSPRI